MAAVKNFDGRNEPIWIEWYAISVRACRRYKVRYRKSTSTSISTSKNSAHKKSNRIKRNEARPLYLTLGRCEKRRRNFMIPDTFFPITIFMFVIVKKESQSIIRSLALVEIHFFPFKYSCSLTLMTIDGYFSFSNAKVWPVLFIFMSWLHFMALYIRTQLSDDE